MSEPLWRPNPERVASTRLTAFIDDVRSTYGIRVDDYADLYRWSIEHLEEFWSAVWDFGDVIAERRGEATIVDSGRMPGAHFFPEARLNFAENLLRGADDAEALVFRGEDHVDDRIGMGDLRDRVARLSAALRTMGVERGDRVAAFLPNLPEAVIGMLASASIGATWSSCSPDFGAEGVVDRFGQIEPKVLICANGYRFKGRWIDSLERIGRFTRHMPSLEHVVIVGYGRDRICPDKVAGAMQRAG